MSTDSIKGMIFDGPSVRAILAGQKTRTTRVAKRGDLVSGIRPRYNPGDVVSVKEAICDGRQDDDISATERVVCYKAGGPWFCTKSGEDWFLLGKNGKRMQPNHFVWPDNNWKSPMFMPKWAARIILRIKSVNIQRVQSLTRADILREGWPGGGKDGHGDCFEWWADRWNSLRKNGSQGTDTPWAWAYEFEVLSTTGLEGVKE